MPKAIRGEIRSWRRVAPRECKGVKKWAIEGAAYDDQEEAYFDGDNIILLSVELMEGANYYLARRDSGETWKLEKSEEVS